MNQTLTQPELLPFLPVIYAIWADGELTDDEIAGARSLLKDLDGLDESIQTQIAPWLDPTQPPSVAELVAMLDVIQSRAKGQPGENLTLADLGAAICPDGACSIKTRHAIKQLGSALGLLGEASAREILAKPVVLSTVESFRALEPDAAFDVQAMKASLDGELMEARDAVRTLLKQPVFRYHYELPKHDEREVVLQWLKILAREGYGKIAFPDVLDSSPDLGAFMATFESLSYFDLSLVIKYGVQFGLFGGSIYFLGTESHHKLLEDVASTELLGCFAMTELGHGSNVRGLTTTATYDHATSEWVINTPDELARKEWIGNAAAHAQMASVFAQLIVDGTSHGVHAFLVPVRDTMGNTLPGVSIDDCHHKMGLNGVDNGRIWFDNVRIPKSNLLNRFGDVNDAGEYESPITSQSRRFFTMLGTLVGGRVSIAASGLSASKTALTIAIRYGAMRRQFGPTGAPEAPILNYRTHQLRLMPLLARAYALNYGIHYLQSRFMNKTHEDEREVEGLAAGLKSYSTWNTTHTIQVARECCGGQGYLTANRFASLKADSDIFTTFEGDNTVLMQLLAKGLLTEYGQQFQNLDFSKAFRLLKTVVGNATTQMDFVTSRRTDKAHLRDHAYLLDLMRFRKESLVASAAQRFKKRLDNGMDSFDALIDVQDHFMSAATAEVELVLVTQFIEAINAESNADVKSHLSTMCSLFGLYQVQEDLAWFMENDVIEPSKSKAIRNEINTLCGEVRQQAIAYTDAFGIPDEVIGAPIAQSTIVLSDESPN